jgi:hypothetical protein
MRSIYGITAAGLGIASILLTGRYGYQMAEAEVDRWVAAIMFGSISLCAFLFDAGAVNLWFRGARKVAAFIGGIASLCLVVTIGNSLGAIVSRADTVEAKRQDVITSREDARRDLRRIEQALEGLGRFTPTDEEAVKAAKRGADAATKSREAECGTTEKQRGGNCRAREADERTANKALADATAAKATTDTARRYEAHIAAIKQRMTVESGEPVGHANPLAAALSSLWGAAGGALTAWHKFIIAVTYELCLVGAMVLHTTLGEVSRHKSAPEASNSNPGALPTLVSPHGPRLAASNPEIPVGSVKRI